MSMRNEFDELIDDIVADMGSMGRDVEWCRSDLLDLLDESADMERTPRTVCTMAHFVMAKRLGTEGVTQSFIDEVAARIAVGYEEMADRDYLED